MPKILHLASDEKFIDAANFLYEKAFPNANIFIILLPNAEDYKVKYILPKKNYRFFKNNKRTLQYVLKTITKYDLVVLHGYDLFKARVVNKNPALIYNYILWGGEIYQHHKKLKDKIYGEKTKKILSKNSYIHNKIKDLFRPFVHLIKYNTFNIYKYQFKTLKYIDYFSILHYEDYQLFKNKNIFSNNTHFLKFTYYPLEFIFGSSKDLIVNNNNILLGNSASYTNNHIEAIDILSKLDIGNRKVVTPLSYGCKDYAEIILNYGKQKLRDKFKPLTEFMPLHEYNKILQTCGVVVMNHYRQQAVGNILASMWLGAKVFLDKRNTFYHYLKRISCHVFSIDELNNNNLQNLSESDIQQNRNILLKEIGTETIVNILKNDFKKILNDH